MLSVIGSKKSVKCYRPKKLSVIANLRIKCYLIKKLSVKCYWEPKVGVKCYRRCDLMLPCDGKNLSVKCY